MTIKDIITRKKKYTSHQDDERCQVVIGRHQCDNRTSTKNTVNTLWLEDYQINIEKFEVEVCGYSKIKEYRRQQNGFRPYLHTFYRYTYPEGKKRLTSRDFRSLDKLIEDMKRKNPDVKEWTRKSDNVCNVRDL